MAELHADTWRRHYRGAYSHAFLDGDVLADRLAVWTDRLREADAQRHTILAENEGLVGFANTFFDDDPRWGALLDNLHVAAGHKRRGIGARLLALTAEAVVERPEAAALYLWVREQNRDAQGEPAWVSRRLHTLEDAHATLSATMDENGVGDAAWLAELLEHGLLRSSFVPPPEIRRLRDVSRYRKRLIQEHSSECQRVRRHSRTPGSSWIRSPPMFLAPRVG